MNYFVFILAFAFLQEVPLKPKEEFEIKLDYQFRPRPTGDHNTVNLGEASKASNHKSSAGVLPYLTLEVRFLSLVEEKMRMSITTNLKDRPFYKKVNMNTRVDIDLGFTDDMIDRVTAHEYTLTFIDAAKKSVDRIVITVGDDGSFFVNGEKRGKL